jgi:hypothetical protein
VRKITTIPVVVNGAASGRDQCFRGAWIGLMHFDRDRRGLGAVLRQRVPRRSSGPVLRRAQLLVEVLEHGGGVLEQAGGGQRIAQIVHLAGEGRLVARQIVDQKIDFDHHHGRQTQRDGQRAGDGAGHGQPPRQPPALQQPHQRRQQHAEQHRKRDGDQDVAGEIQGGDHDRQNDEIGEGEACRNDQGRSPLS